MKERPRPGRRAFLGTAMAGGALALVPRASRAAAPAFDLEEATLPDLTKRMASGELTARALTAAYLDRIAGLDRQGPTLRSVIETNPDALAIAEALDRERREKGPRGPLHGIPVLLKDNIDTADRMTTTAGSLALAGSIPPRDSFVAQRLREAGAVLLGKANLSEWANIRSSQSSSGWSARGGQCKNPYVLDRNPCGSSSGSAVAVSANLCALAIGTETDGSIVCPSNARLIHHPRELFTDEDGPPTPDVEVPYHGDIDMYDMGPDPEREWIEYRVRFTHGRVDELWRLGREGEGDRAPSPVPAASSAAVLEPQIREEPRG